MLQADEVVSELVRHGIDFATGVPCSFLTGFLNRVIACSDIPYCGATSEGEAVGLAAGAYLAGRQPMVLCQNSGLGNMVNPLTSLAHPFRIPMLLIVTWRGEPETPDEPQHGLMGAITKDLLATLQVPSQDVPQSIDELRLALGRACDDTKERHCSALVITKGTFVDEPALSHEGHHGNRGRNAGPLRCVSGSIPPKRIDVLRAIIEDVDPETAIIATTGKTGRELFTVADRPQHLYVVGSMGCASAVALGVALNVERPVMILDGDGAALMKLGTMATIGHQAPANLIHIVLDNGCHDSTGGQPTASGTVDFAAVALACGYTAAATCDHTDALPDLIRSLHRCSGPALISCRISPGSMEQLGRPSLSPQAVADRFRAFLAPPKT